MKPSRKRKWHHIQRREPTWVVGPRNVAVMDSYLRRVGEASAVEIALALGRPRTRVAHYLRSHPEKYECLMRTPRGKRRVVYRLLEKDKT